MMDSFYFCLRVSMKSSGTLCSLPWLLQEAMTEKLFCGIAAQKMLTMSFTLITKGS